MVCVLQNVDAAVNTTPNAAPQRACTQVKSSMTASFCSNYLILLGAHAHALLLTPFERIGC